MKRVILLICTFALLLPSLASGGGQGQKEAEAKKTIVHYERTSPAEDKINFMLVEKFMAENPNVEVKWVLFEDSDRVLKVRTTLAARGQLDTCSLTDTDALDFLSKGVMVEIIPEGFGVDTVDQVVKMWQPGTMQSLGSVYEGKYYGLPHQQANYVGWINTKFMREAGLNPESDIPRTWDDFVSVAKKMTIAEGGVRTRNGFGTNAKAAGFQMSILTAMVTQQGIDWNSDDSFLQSMDHPNTAKAFTTFTNFVLKDKIWDPALFDNDREAFGNGLTATFLTGGSWYWGNLDAFSVPREDVRPFAYPRYPDGRDSGGIGYGYCMYVTEQSQDPELAFRFIDFMTQPNEFIKIGYVMPKATLDTALADKYIPYYAEVFKPELARTVRRLPSLHYLELFDAGAGAIQRIIFERVSVENSIRQLKEDITTIVR